MHESPFDSLLQSGLWGLDLVTMERFILEPVAVQTAN